MRDRLVKGLDKTDTKNPVLKGRDLLDTAKTFGRGEDPLAVLHGGAPPQHLSSGQIPNEPKGRSARHLRMQVMLQRQLDDQNTNTQYSTQKVGTQGSFSMQVRQKRQEEQELVAHPPRDGAKRSGVKLRSRSSAPVN